MRREVADKRCENGHFIDETWDLCPYCPQEKPKIAEMPVVRPRATSVASPSVASSVATPAVADPPVAAVAGPQRTVVVPKLEQAAAATKRYVVAWLIGLNGPTKGEAFPIRMGRNIIGRDRKSDVFINDEQASAHHADLVYRPEEGRYILMDHNSTNGTYVNDNEIEPRRDLVDNDIVRIGMQKFLFRALCGPQFNWDSQDLK